MPGRPARTTRLHLLPHLLADFVPPRLEVRSLYFDRAALVIELHDRADLVAAVALVQLFLHSVWVFADLLQVKHNRFSNFDKLSLSQRLSWGLGEGQGGDEKFRAEEVEGTR